MAEKRRYHKGNVAEDMVLAAKRILAEERVEDVTARRLCREVGVTSANFYNHFESRESLLLDIAADAFGELVELNLAVAKSRKPRSEKLVEIAVNLVEFAYARFQLYRIMFDAVEPHGNPQHKRALDSSRHAFGTLAEVIYGEDRYRPEDLEWSHKHCQEAYAYHAFMNGLAHVVAQKMIDLPQKSRRQAFVRDLAGRVAAGLLPVLPGEPA